MYIARPQPQRFGIDLQVRPTGYPTDRCPGPAVQCRGFCEAATVSKGPLRTDLRITVLYFSPIPGRLHYCPITALPSHKAATGPIFPA